MNAWKTTTGLFFLAAMSVYPGRATAADPATPAPVVVDTGGAGSATARNEPPLKISEPMKEFRSKQDQPLVGVLGALSQTYGQSIVASRDVQKMSAVGIGLYNITYREALEAICKQNDLRYRDENGIYYVYTRKEHDEILKAERRTATEIFPIYYVPSADAERMIKQALSADGKTSVTAPTKTGIESNKSEAGGDSQSTEGMLVVTDYPENIEEVRRLLKTIDRRPQQVQVDAVILRATLSEDNSLGIDFTLLGGVDFRNLSGAGGTAAALSGSILDSNTAGAQKVVDNGAGIGKTGFTSGLPSGGLRVGLISNNVAVFLQALEGVTDTVVLANTKVLTLNKQRGEVLVGREDGYQTSTVTETAQVQDVKFLETGTRLIFRPYVGDDSYVRMEIHPEDSSGGLTDKNLPFKTTTEVTTNVMVKDGRTIVIGGLFRESNNVSRSQIPGLGNLPLAGPLFRSQRDQTTREEVIILLTPHIIKDEAAYAQASEQEKREMEKLRVGVRRGMMPIGRERLAECSYDQAVQEANKPNADRKKVLWYLDCATNLNPKFLEAIDMKARITGREVASVDNSSIREFLRNEMLLEHPAQPSSRPAAPVLPMAPATKPVADATTAPSTRPAVCEGWVSSVVIPMESLLEEALKVRVVAEETAANPATRPAGGENAPGTRVTELPMEGAN